MNFPKQCFVQSLALTGNVGARKGFLPRNQPHYCAVELLWRVNQIVLELTRSLTMESLGRKRWAIAEGYIPSESSFTDPALMSHETACILNAGDRNANVHITLFFSDRDPAGPYLITVGARRTLHLKFNDLNDPKPVPRDTAYSSVFESDVPIVVQHTRLDSRRAEVSLLSTTAYAEA
jgi:hypothetical protein